jgi:acyl-CoA thioesterase FadM
VEARVVRATEVFRGDQVVLRAATTWAFMALTNGRPIKIPDELRALFG